MKVAESVVVFAILWIISAQAAEFVEEPTSVNVTEGTTAIFNCTAYSLGFHWLINDEIIEHPHNTQRGIQKIDTTIDDDTNLKIHLLIIPGTAKNNDLTITCYVYDFITISSNPARLLVQGLLDEVNDVNITQLNTTSIEISFTPPNTLIGTPITNYSIDVLADEEDPVITYWILHENIIIHLNDSCVNYTLEIAAWNEVGRGDTEMISVILHQVPLEPPTTPNSEIQFISELPHVVLYTTIVSSCVGRIPDNITILLDPINTFTNTPIATCHHMYSCNDGRFTLTHTDDTVWMLSVNISSDFLPGRHYRAQFVFRNKAGITHSSVINISTFQTHLANIDYVNDIVCVDCYFTEGSTSGGCLAVFVDNNNQLSNQTVFAPRSKTINNYGRNCDNRISAGNYTVFIYDSSYGKIESGVVLYINTVINESPESSTQATTTLATTTLAITTLAITTQTTILQITSTRTDPTKSVTLTETLEDGTNPLPLLVIVLCVSGGTLALLIILILLLMFCLIRYKKKNRSLKIAEIDARQNQRNAENVLYSLTWTSGSEQIYSPDPVYENMDEIQLRVTNPNTVAMQNCPAYVTLPNAIKK